MANSTASIQDVHKDNPVCICCTSSHGNLINIITCSHAKILNDFIKLKLIPEKWYVCGVCHNMLKKIDTFKRQVAESVAMLTQQANISKITKLHNLQQSQVDTLDFTTTITDIKITLTPVKVENDSEKITRVKIKKEIPKSNPSTNIKKIKSRRYEGKIALVILSDEELAHDREKTKVSEAYVKLPFKCETCIVGFDHDLSLKRHIASKHYQVQSEFKCKICETVLSSKLAYSIHVRGHYKRFVCQNCGRVFIRLESAARHYDSTHATLETAIHPSYTCKECDFETSSHREFRHHVDRHKAKPECELCCKTFVTTNALRVHMNNVHDKMVEQYKCSQCDKTYTSKSGLLAHSRYTHSKAAKSYCQVCRTQFQNIQALRHHVRTHSNHVTEDDKKFICDICGAKFTLKYYLRIHINWEHMKTNAHCCDICAKPFKTSTELRRHVNYVHEKKLRPKNKICQYCGYTCTTNRILQFHIRTHTGEKPFHCDQCPSKFAQSSTLYTHKKLVHKRTAKLQ